MPANSEPLHETSDRHNYWYRRRLGATEILPALAVGVGVGFFAFYVARLLSERTPLVPEGKGVRRRPRSTGVAG